MSRLSYLGTPSQPSLWDDFAPVSDPSPATLQYKDIAPSDRYGYRRSAVSKTSNSGDRSMVVHLADERSMQEGFGLGISFFENIF